MSVRLRILFGAVFLVLLPLAVFGQLVSRWMETRFTGQFNQRVEGLVEIIREDLDEQRLFVQERLIVLSEELADDNRFRVGVGSGDAQDQAYVRNQAQRAMHLLGLDMLQIQDETGRILSCGHFWNKYGSRQAGLPQRLIESADPWVLLETSRQEGAFLALANVDSLTIGTEEFYLVGGIELGARYLRRLVRDQDLIITLDLPNGHPLTSLFSADTTIPERSIVRSAALPLVEEDAQSASPSVASLTVIYPLAPLDDLLGQFRRWLLLLIGVLAIGSVILAFWLSRHISRPIVELAQQAGAIDLERLDVRFRSRRQDEVGVLARFLDQMMVRLRGSAQRLREVERRATQGEMARQVNHDIKNGLIPIRNVFRHLSELLTEEPQALPKVFDERRAVLETSILYLEELAANYARISQAPRRQSCQLNEIVRQVSASAEQPGRIAVRLVLDPQIGEISIDPVALRRIIENLTRNACESMETGGGLLELSTASRTNEAGDPGFELSITDSGPGIPPEVLERIFDDFFTTKERGSGLGLSIVRRLVSDFDGTIRAQNVRDGQPPATQGARFVLWFPKRSASIEGPNGGEVE